MAKKVQLYEDKAHTPGKELYPASRLDIIYSTTGQHAFPGLAGKAGKALIVKDDETGFTTTDVDIVRDVTVDNISVVDVTGVARVDLSSKASKAAFETHLADGNRHVTLDEKSKWNEAFTKRHVHDNKDLLDEYMIPNSMLVDTVNKSHVHTNKEELDKILTGDKAKWDAKQSTMIAGANIQIAPDGVTISATDTIYDDTAVKQLITDEETRAKDAESLLNNAVTVERTRAENKENSIQTALNTEISRATTAENAMINTLNNHEVRVVVLEGKMPTDGGGCAGEYDLNYEVARAKLAEKTEQDARTNKDNELDAEIVAVDNKIITHSANMLIHLDDTTKSHIDLCYAAKHTHANKVELDKIQSGDKAYWDGKQGKLIAGHGIEIASDNTIGVILTDTVDGKRYKLKVTGGVLGIELV